MLGISAAVVLEAGALGAVTNHAKRGALYQGTGRQPNWPPGYLAWGRTFSLRFAVARDGRYVTQIWVWDLNAFCRRDRYPATPNPRLGSAPIRSDGTFQVDLKPTDGGLSSVRVVGRFLSQGRATGTVSYRGRYHFEPFRCNADGTWTARVAPPPPPVKRFTGTTSQGTLVTFQRTIEPQSHVMRFDFGMLKCQGVTWKVRVATGARIQAGPPVQFSLPVRRGRFSGRYSTPPQFVTIGGRIDAKNQASGTVTYRDPTCFTGTVSWTAHP